ncbi:MAG: DUF5319 family protein, partial [Acidimicrobiia bacterium]
MRDRRRSSDDELRLEEDERRGLERDLVDASILRDTLGKQGIKGATFYCSQCDEDHY